MTVIIILGSVLCSLSLSNHFPIAAKLSCIIALVSMVVPVRKFLKLNLRIEFQAIAKPTLVIIATILLVSLVHSFFPFYRYDQWNYHLVLAKYLMQGPLPPSVRFESIYFTGAYEYFLSVFRVFLSDDIVNHSIVNGFSTSLFLILTAYALRLMKLSVPWCIGLSMLVFYTFPERMALTNAKPDGFFIPITLLILARSFFVERNKKNAGITAFLLTIPLALKISWLHAAFPLTLLVWWKFRTKIPQLFKGHLLGGLAFVPIAAKNTLFFGNPLHPSQSPLFQSSFWNHAMDHYWYISTGPSRDLTTYFTQLMKIVAQFPQFFGIALAFLTIFLLLTRSSQSLIHIIKQEALVVTFAAWGIFVLCWPIFFSHDIGPRFVAPFWGFAAFIFASTIHYAQGQKNFLQLKRVQTLLILVLLATSRLDVHVRDIYSYIALGSPFDISQKPVYQAYREQIKLNKHRQHTFPNAQYHQKTVLSSTPMLYFSDAMGIVYKGYEYLYWQEKLQTDLAGMIKKFDIAYAYQPTEELIQALNQSSSFDIRPVSNDLFWIKPSTAPTEVYRNSKSSL